ncbi:MAG: anaerobic ribonucleoside-triphosphate reductase [bacterium]|nr:anaerobic ribonucleoside-triphosphate reductase [bacterium]
MFKYIKKRDGEIVPFSPKKISNAIFKAARKVGGEDRELADKLTVEVIAYLYEKAGDHTPTVEEVQDAVEKILIERGHAKTAKEYILYRDARARLRKIAPKTYKETTDYALFVRSSKDNILTWDRRKIVDAMIREAGVLPDMAEKISLEVEQQIKSWNINTLTASLIRELVDVKLIEYGLEDARKLHTRLGLPLADAGRLIIFRNKENANIPHNPEATNLTLAEAIKKEYALINVFSDDVADAHIRGDIHLHDLGMIDRPYSFMGNETILIRQNGIVQNISLKNLFSKTIYQYEENGFEIKPLQSIEVYDKNGWVKLGRIVRHKAKKPMLWIETSCGNSLVVTSDHPMMLYSGYSTPAANLKEGDSLLSSNLMNRFIEKTSHLEVEVPLIISNLDGLGIEEDIFPTEVTKIRPIEIQDEYVYDITTETGTFFCNGIWTHNCSGQSLEYVKKFGLDLTNSLSIAKPAKHPETLLAHMVKYAAALQGCFAGAIGWDAVNLFFSPFLVGLSEKDIKQIAQMMIFEFSQQSVARGGQAIFSDINIYWEIPKHFEDVPAIGPSGEYTGKVYKDYSKEAKQFAWALFDVYKEGDGAGRPFFFPKPLVHITEKFFQEPDFKDFLYHICDVAGDKGNTYFVFDRDGQAKVSECCRLSFQLDARDLEDAKHPWKMRYTALQNITINLPRCAYLAKGDTQKLFDRLEELMKLSVKAHLQKKVFIERLLALDEDSSLSLLNMRKDGEPYLRMHRATYLIGLLGLNEMVEFHTGSELHESEEVLKFGLKVISYLHLLCKKLGNRYGIRLVLEQTPAESSAYRLAELDLEHYPEASRVVKGDKERGEVYYTNSTYLNISEAMNPIDRVKKEGLFHPLIEAGALSHIWLADASPSPESIANFVIKTFQNTKNAQIAFSPEFTFCMSCHKVVRGLKEECPYCKSRNVEGITRVTGYFSRISGWNKGKIGELRDRYRGGIE